jgi:predicted dinucleotide-binding enzyme
MAAAQIIITTAAGATSRTTAAAQIIITTAAGATSRKTAAAQIIITTVPTVAILAHNPTTAGQKACTGKVRHHQM